MRRLVLIVGLCGCGLGKPEVPVDDPRATAIEAIASDPEPCPFHRAEYCLEGLIEPAIDETLASAKYKKLGGTLPATDRSLHRFVGDAKLRYRSMHMAEEAQREAVLAKMRAHYDSPPSERLGDAVYVDLGVLPTGFRKARAGYDLETTSPLLDGFVWSGAEAAKHFLAARSAHPDATSFVMRLVVPRGTSTATLVMAWYPERDQIAVRDGMSYTATRAPLGSDLGALASGRVSLTRDWLSCSPGDGGAVADGCPPAATWRPER